MTPRCHWIWTEAAILMHYHYSYFICIWIYEKYNCDACAYCVIHMNLD